MRAVFLGDYANFSSSTDSRVYEDTISVPQERSPLTKSPKGFGYHVGTAAIGAAGLAGAYPGLSIGATGIAFSPRKRDKLLSAGLGLGLAGLGAALPAYHVLRRQGRKGLLDWSPDYNTHANWRKERATQMFQKDYDQREQQGW